VFKADVSNETALYSFAGSADGAFPFAVIRDGAGNLYGTTTSGGDFTCNPPFGCGVEFKVDTTGKETVLYTFRAGADGAVPEAGLVQDTNGNLYGTTTNDILNPKGPPTAFKLDPAGKQTVLHEFAGFPTDGRFAFAALILDSAGNLYGTTVDGGTSDAFSFTGSGTVFKLTPPGFLLSASALTPARISRGTSATATVNVTAAGGFGGSVAFTCSVQPSPMLGPKCAISPASTTPGSPAMLTVNTTPPTASALRSHSGSGPFYVIWLPLIGLFVTVAHLGSKQDTKRRIRAATLTCLLLNGLVFAVAGGGGNSNGEHSNGTPAGMYTVAVTGTSNSPGITPQMTQVTLTVH